MGDTEATSDYSGSLSSTTSSDESETEERVKKVSDKDKASESSLLWVGNGIKKCPLIIFRPESIISRERKLKSIGEKYHLSYKMVKTESKLVRSLLSAYGFHEVHPNSADFNLMWTGAHLKPFSLRTLQDFQKVNHFPRSYEITRKDRLYKNIERMAHTKGAKHFDFIPKSYLMPSEYQEFCAAFVKEKGSWIVKPIASSRGRGIYLINNPNQVPLEDNIMVCRYISNPLLVDGFKFDIRVYVAVTSYDPLLVYLFEEGLTRFATVKYEKTNRHLKNQMMHLTNYSINKKSHDYVRCEDPDVEDYGNKWSMSAMLRYLKQEGIDTAQLMVKIEAVIIKSILAAELPIATACKMFVPHKENCIELYGFDILVDENLKPWILEGNLSPSLACDAPLDLKIKSSMVADFFSLAGFNCIDPMTRKQNKKHLDVMRRPYSASKTASPQNAGSNLGTAKRPSSAATVPKDVSSGGLSSEEAKVLKMAKEQYQRRGSFVRIFPTAESWEQYGSFLEYKSSLNHMLAQKLFPDLSYSSKSSTGAYSSAVARMKNVAANQLLEGRHHLVAARSMQYERKLLSLESCKKKRHAPHRKSKHPTPVGVDTKKSTNHVTSSSSSSRRLYGNDEDSSDEETTATTTNYSSKTSTGISKPSRPISTASGATGEGKLPRAPAKRLPSAHAGSKDPGSVGTGAKQPAGAATLGRKPSQRVYMYKTDAGKDKGEISGRKTPSISANGKQQSIESQKSIPRASDAQNPADEVSSSGSDSERSKDTASSSTGASAVVGAAGSRAKATATPIVQGGKNKGKASFDVLEMLKAGRNLGKIQARQAFSSYLSKVQQRLMTESDSRSNEGSEVVAKQEEQMDLVLRFLKRAAANLRQPFSVVVPSRRLSLHDRKRILAKQLGDFVHVYNKETEGMEHKNQLGLHKETSEITLRNGDRMVEDSQFRSFMVGASELSLEEVLTAYTHKNKSASVFLGASKPKTPHIRSPSSEKSSAGGQQSGEGNMLHKTGSGGMPPNHYSHTSSQIFLPSDQASSASDHVPSPSSSSHSSHSYSHFSSGSSHGLSGMSSMQQAALVYGAKLHSPKSFQSQRRPASAKPFSQNSVHMQQSHQARPVSASCRPLGNNLHYQSSSNHEKLADALQKLTEKQAARKYSAPVQLTTLTQHLSSLNLSSMDSMQRNHQAITNSNSARQGNLAKKSASLCDLATFDPSVQSMVDPAQHGKFTVLRGSPTAKYGNKKNPGDPDQPLQHNALGHHSIMSQGESRDGEKNFNEMLRVQIFSRALASKQDEQKNLLKLQIINFFAAEAAQKQQQKGSSGAKGGHGSIQAIYHSLFAVGELPSKQCKKQFRQKLRKTKSANVQKVGKGKRGKKSDNLGSAQTRGAAYDKGRERLAGNPLQLLTKPPSIPRRPEPPKLNERPLQTRKLNARAINDYDVQSSMGPDFYTSLKYDSQTGSTRTYERQLSETSSNGSRKHTWKP